MTALMQSFISKDMIYAAIKAVIDPELGINIVDLGLIYSVEIEENGRIIITMTLTTPGCPLHASFAQEIERILWQSIPDLKGVYIELVWEPAWNPTMISADGRATLGIE